MTEPATQLLIPGSSPALPSETLSMSISTPWILAIGTVVIWVLWLVLNRRRSIHPEELAFRRLIAGLGLSRSEVRSIRRVAISAGLAPAAIALSPELTAKAIRDGGKRTSRSLARLA